MEKVLAWQNGGGEGFEDWTEVGGISAVGRRFERTDGGRAPSKSAVGIAEGHGLARGWGRLWMKERVGR